MSLAASKTPTVVFQPSKSLQWAPSSPCRPPVPVLCPTQLYPLPTSHHHERPWPARRPPWMPTYPCRTPRIELDRTEIVIGGRIFRIFPRTFLPPMSSIERWRPTRPTRIQQQYQHQQPNQQEALALVFRPGCRRHRPGCRRRRRRRLGRVRVGRGRSGGGTQTKQTTHIFLAYSFIFALLADIGAGRSIRLFLTHPPLQYVYRRRRHEHGLDAERRP